jgi:hypothetical protein
MDPADRAEMIQCRDLREPAYVQVNNFRFARHSGAILLS